MIYYRPETNASLLFAFGLAGRSIRPARMFTNNRPLVRSSGPARFRWRRMLRVFTRNGSFAASETRVPRPADRPHWRDALPRGPGARHGQPVATVPRHPTTSALPKSACRAASTWPLKSECQIEYSNPSLASAITRHGRLAMPPPRSAGRDGDGAARCGSQTA